MEVGGEGDYMHGRISNPYHPRTPVQSALISRLAGCITADLGSARSARAMQTARSHELLVTRAAISGCSVSRLDGAGPRLV